jgi:hypothetical protein
MPKFHSWEHYASFKGAFNRRQRSLRRQRETRRLRLLELVATGQYRPNETGALAAELGVTPETIRVDRIAIENEMGRCLHCGQILPEVADFVAAE